LFHSLRVKQLALVIAKSENLDGEVLIATAYLHDVGRGAEQRGGGDHVQIGIRAAGDLLPRIGFPSAKIPQVLDCIAHHEEYPWAASSNAPALTKEVLGFQDADRLDALGAVGMARCFAYAGACRIPIWNPLPPEGTWSHGKLSRSAFAHLLEKIVRLRDTMNTRTGKYLAQRRHRFVVKFVEEFRQECSAAFPEACVVASTLTGPP